MTKGRSCQTSYADVKHSQLVWGSWGTYDNSITRYWYTSPSLTYDPLLYFHWQLYVLTLLIKYVHTSLSLRLSHTTIMFCRCIKYTEYWLTSVVQIFPLFYYFSWKPTLFKFSTNYEKSYFNFIVEISVEDFRDQHFKYINVWSSSNIIF